MRTKRRVQPKLGELQAACVIATGTKKIVIIGDHQRLAKKAMYLQRIAWVVITMSAQGQQRQQPCSQP